MRGNKLQAGFSLLEMLMVIGMMAMLFAVAGALFATSSQSYLAGQTTGLVLTDLRYALNYMTTHLREATNVTVVPNPSGPEIRFNILVNGASQAWIFRQSGDTIQKVVGTNSQPLCSYVGSLSFTKNDRQVQILLLSVSSVSGGAKGARLPVRLHTTLYLRN
ncbi:MAG: prepilin-type N-terminal cleavage/methylation domain-containing protein [bacterium]|nr:prepilin-type N-terminal cleavage/methylation domain-containing protein [bacterium]